MAEYDLIYLAKPVYGGWVTFTAHLAQVLRQRGHRVRLWKVTKHGERKPRAFGYGVAYCNLAERLLPQLENPVIVALDKNYIGPAQRLPGCKIVIHDPTELTPAVVAMLAGREVITIRSSVQEYLQSQYGIPSRCILHPFFAFTVILHNRPRGAPVAVSRVDYDKHTKMILQANELCRNKVYIYGAVNRLYVHHGGLDALGFQAYYKGVFNRTFDNISAILQEAEYMVDMSAIHNDGAGSQYTFLEAMYMGAALVLNKKWFDGQPTGALRPGVNCFAAGSPQELAAIVDGKHKPTTERVARAAQRILKPHIGWEYSL